ncbi:MAG: hypothetical protein CMB80_29550 [Flammeovirgaceae bacterium]|nr:hypothetical protein [Flammeovirgaceae bacterium]MBE62309.1 hypothetical protein [Flammeovirgaceae bacterium]HCX20334.1 hypothetical protein [Cytophagales bacterium]
MYQELYDEKHSFILTTNHEITKPDGKKSFRPTGEYEGNLLCQNCDNKIIGDLETYASKTLYGKGLPPEQAPVVINHKNQQGIQFSFVKNIDYKKFKLFLLSILWRASISTRPFFNEVSLGPHEERLRKMIFEGNPGGEMDYPFQLKTYINDKSMPTDYIGQPRTMRYEGHRIVTFFICGIFYGFLVSSHSKPTELNSTTIKKSNELKILHVPQGKGWEFIAKFAGISTD